MSEKRYEVEMVLRHEGGGDMFRATYYHLDLCDMLKLEAALTQAVAELGAEQAEAAGCQ